MDVFSNYQTYFKEDPEFIMSQLKSLWRNNLFYHGIVNTNI